MTDVARGESQVRKFLKRLGVKCRKCGVIPGKLDKAKMKQLRDFKEKQLGYRLDEVEAGQSQVNVNDRSILWTPLSS